ncbi:MULTISPECIES: hypothetical protein [unclassified Azospirillum]|uniref:hypothetical protein n=1 Tax=unclassified Azospirillum TaxID=2630922 RepID=UPI000B6FC5DE|nr:MULTISPECIES: hypothetical protein [unclassified Azospirillum]SNS76355.1 hypothetical protein SAMN05880556_11148 [Azospirillum sp. RU38E]SNS93562.1 hypothetical protein SAMN05880591_11148 [Azospirillum sp. RU37A]
MAAARGARIGPLITNSLDRITAAEKTLSEIDSKLALLNRLTVTPDATDPAADQLLQQQQELTRQRQAQVDAVMAANTVLDFIFRQGVADCMATDGSAATPVSCELNRSLAVIRHEASIVMDSVALSLLPLLYGWLGANVYILRRLIGGLDNWNINALLATKLSLRRFLGALLGIAVGIVYKPGGTQLSEAGFSMALFAFLAGYSVEFIFTILDTLIARGNAAFPSPYKRRRTSAQPRRVPTVPLSSKETPPEFWNLSTNVRLQTPPQTFGTTTMGRKAVETCVA